MSKVGNPLAIQSSTPRLPSNGRKARTVALAMRRRCNLQTSAPPIQALTFQHRRVLQLIAIRCVDATDQRTAHRCAGSFLISREPPPTAIRWPRVNGVAARALFSGAYMKQINPDAQWERLVSAQAKPSRKLFDTLFVEGDREAIILATLPLIRRFNNSPKAIRDDVEMYAVGKVTKAVDELLQKPNTNPGSYLLDVIIGAIHEAKFGTGKEARDCVSTNRRIYRPRPKPTDAERKKLVRKLELDGCSEAMIRAELESRGLDQSRIVTTETEWPSSKVREDGHYTGERTLAEFGAEQPVVDDRWELLGEICEDDELLILELLSHGHTHEYVAEALGVHETTITKRLATIRAKVQRHEAD